MNLDADEIPDEPTSIICEACGTEFLQAKFCPECGTPTEPPRPTCQSCGHQPEAVTRFCPECGAKMPLIG